MENVKKRLINKKNFIILLFIENSDNKIKKQAMLGSAPKDDTLFRFPNIEEKGKPSFATVGIFSFLWSYNDLFSQTFFLRFKDQWAITRLLMEISSREGTDYGLMAAVVTLIIVPLLVVYVCLQKYIIKGMTAGAVKG